MRHSAIPYSVYQTLKQELIVYQRALKDLNSAFLQREIEIRELKAELKACHDGLASIPRVVEQQAD